MLPKDVSPLNVLTSKMSHLTAKASMIGRFVLDSPHNVPHMSSRKLASACGTSESSVIRFARQLGYPGYTEFQAALRGSFEQDSDKPFSRNKGHAPPFLETRLWETHNALNELVHFIDMKVFRQLVTLICQSRKVYIVGQGATFHYAAQMGWEISQIRDGVRFFDIHDRHFETEIVEAPKGTAVIFLAEPICSRAMVQAARTASGLDLWVAAISPGLPCPLAEFSYLMVTYGSPGNPQKQAPLNLNFMISCITRMARDENMALRTTTSAETHFLSDAPEEEQTLKIGMWAPPASLDPSFAAGTRREWPVIACIFNGLVKYEEGSWNVIPDIASSWTVSKDNLSIIFYLRKGVMLHRGYGELTSEDVKFSIERSCTGYFKRSMNFIDRIDIIDRYTVSLVLKEPNFHLFKSILPFIPGKIISKKAMEELGPVRFAFNPVGTGPYEFKGHSSGDRIRLRRFKEYWGNQPKMEVLEFSPLKERDIKNSLKSGSTHITRLPFANFKLVKDLPNVAYDINYGLDHWLIGMNVTRPPFNDIRARQAVRYAVDIDAVIRRAFGGVPERSYSPIPSGAVGYWEDAPRYKVDLSKAKKRIKEVLGKKEISARLLLMPGESDRIAGEIIRENLEKIGIHVDFHIQTTDMFNEAAKKGDFDFYITFSSCPIDPTLTLNWFRSGEEWNCSHWKNKNYDNVIEKAAREMDLEKRGALLISAQKIIDQDCWALWITNGTGIVLRQRNVDPGTLFPDGSLAPWLIQKK